MLSFQAETLTSAAVVCDFVLEKTKLGSTFPNKQLTKTRVEKWKRAEPNLVDPTLIGCCGAFPRGQKKKSSRACPDSNPVSTSCAENFLLLYLQPANMSRRICSSHQLLNCVETVSTNLARPAGGLRLGSSQHARSLSTTPALAKSSNNDQRRMRRWMKTVGKTLKSPTAGRPNYLSGFQDQPFPLNPTFRSHPVLSENSRTQIWSDIIEKGQGLKEVSAKYGVDIKRVAAVVRLKEVEKQWEAQVRTDCDSLFPNDLVRFE